jgi:hypothetical protein
MARGLVRACFMVYLVVRACFMVYLVVRACFMVYLVVYHVARGLMRACFMVDVIGFTSCSGSGCVLGVRCVWCRGLRGKRGGV